MFPRDVLNRIRWTGNSNLNGVEIHVLHRGAPGDRKVILGEEVAELEHSYIVMETEGKETRIPYHRVQKIFLNTDFVYDRSAFTGENREQIEHGRTSSEES